VGAGSLWPWFVMSTLLGYTYRNVLKLLMYCGIQIIPWGY
jgi:hypothetical protein